MPLLILVALVLAALLATHLSSPSPFLSNQLLLLMIMGGTLGIGWAVINYIRYRERRRDWANDMDDWENTWLCLSCGASFRP